MQSDIPFESLNILLKSCKITLSSALPKLLQNWKKLVMVNVIGITPAGRISLFKLLTRGSVQHIDIVRVCKG